MNGVSYKDRLSRSVNGETLVLQKPDSVGLVPLIWQHRSWLAVFVLRCTAVAAIAVLLWPNHYRSTTRIIPPDSQSNQLMSALLSRNLPGNLAGVAGDVLGGGKDSGPVFISMLRSRTVADRIIDKFDLRKVYWDRYMDTARRDLEDFTTVEEDRKSNVITISVVDRSKERAMAIAKMYVDELNRTAAELNTSAAHRERVFIEDRLRSVKANLDDLSKKLSEFSTKNTAIDIKEQGKAMLEGAAELQGQIIAAESELSGLEEIYSKNNVRVRSLQSRIAELKRQLQELGGTDASLESNSGQQSMYPTIRQLPRLGLSYTELYREVKIQETVYEMLTKQYELAKIEEAKEFPTIKVLDDPDLAERKDSPHRLLLISLSALFSFCLGSVLLFARERWHNRDDDDADKVVFSECFQSGREFFRNDLRPRNAGHLLKTMWRSLLPHRKSSGD